MVDLDLMGSEDVPLPESELKKRSPRRRAKKEEEPEHAITEKKEERLMEEVKLPSKASKTTEIFFDEDIEE